MTHLSETFYLPACSRESCAGIVVNQGVFGKSALVCMIGGGRVDVQCMRLCLPAVSVDPMMGVVLF